MPRLRVKLDKGLDEEALKEGIASLASHEEDIQVVKALIELMRRGDLSLFVSRELMRELRAFAAKQQAVTTEDVGQIDDTLLLSWLQQGCQMGPRLRWEVESLPNNAGIYRILLEGGDE